MGNRGRARAVAAVVAISAIVAGSVSSTAAFGAEPGPKLVSALQRGGYVVYFRHAATDFSQTDTTRNLADCTKQRNLIPEGRADATAIGKAFRALRIPVGQVLASKYCRTRQTARLAFGRVHTSDDITSIASVSDEEQERRLDALRGLLATTPRAGTNTVLVAHLFNIQGAADVSLEEGEAAVFEPLGDRRFRLVAKVRPRKWTTLATSAREPTFVVREYPLPAGKRPHDVAPALDGGVWYTAQGSGELGWLDPKSGRTRHIALGEGSAPHGVIVGPDGAPWITDGGLNAIVRVDPKTDRVDRYDLPASSGYANLNTATFDRDGVLWFTGQSGVYGSVDPKVGEVEVFRAPRGTGPYGITTTPAGDVYYASLAGSYLGRIELGRGTATVLQPPTRGQGARRAWSDSRGRIWVSEWDAGKLGMYDPARRRWQEWDLPGTSPMPYAVYVDERDKVWLSDFGANALVRFDPVTQTFVRVRLPSSPADVRQLHGRPGEVWGAESGTNKLLVVRLGKSD